MAGDDDDTTEVSRDLLMASISFRALIQSLDPDFCSKTLCIISRDGVEVGENGVVDDCGDVGGFKLGVAVEMGGNEVWLVFEGGLEVMLGVDCRVDFLFVNGGFVIVKDGDLSEFMNLSRIGVVSSSDTFDLYEGNSFEIIGCKGETWGSDGGCWVAVLGGLMGE